MYRSDSCDVTYYEDRNIVFVKWKSFCSFKNYRKPLEYALGIIKKYGCNYVADTRNGFENVPEDTKWVAEYFMPMAAAYGCQCIYFLIDENNALKDELEGQQADSSAIIDFKYIYSLEDIV
ncbi:MAG: hypothetical protein E7502_02100 [Ruminococcus sp.]|nr:hypothetical protein [Ruminococcus sp.]